MSKFFKKIPISIVVLIITLIISWATFITSQSYAQRELKNTVTNHITQTQKKQDFIENKLEEIQRQMTDDNKKLQDKISQNNKDIYKMLIDIQKQIGGRNG